MMGACVDVTSTLSEQSWQPMLIDGPRPDRADCGSSFGAHKSPWFAMVGSPR
jgi:hypothetical protein